ncbi:hypothetical protein [Intrasporangium sp.]|uniref:hypothetical protein n=1 Tax=Intrasporangium sp. TaxID=1925024 RepID=UPI003221D4A1
MTAHDGPGDTRPIPVRPSGATAPAASRPADAQATRRPARRWPTRLAWALVAVCLASLGTLGYGYQRSLDSSRDWKALADSTTVALEATRTDLDRTSETLTRTKLALDETRKALDETKGSLSAVAGQYDEASERIRELADEKAKVGDEAGLLATAVAQAARLQDQLDTCVTGLRNLQAYLVAPDSPDPAALAAVVAQVNAGCDEAQNQSRAFQDWLEGR